MAYKDDTCSWDDMKDQFQILRHALRLKIPIMDNGEIDCFVMSGGQPKRRFPRLDYSKGFPDWWWLDSIDISVSTTTHCKLTHEIVTKANTTTIFQVPSQHMQEGKRYAAEVTLEHFYEIPHVKNQVRTTTIPMRTQTNNVK